tara:strand:+ start:176 stop:730 length:555 start_codon:yes stop_codon:yes gene_type:complete
MDQEIQKTLDLTKEKMNNSILFLEKELLNIRAGKANPVMLNSVSIDYYGNPTPLNQLSSINTPDARSISIQPWEKSLLPDIEKAIIDANLGFNPMNNGESILINIPPLTEERRRELVKLAKIEAENAKINIRNARKDANHSIKKMMFPEDLQKNAEIDIQDLTDKFISRVDSIFSVKEKEILTL